MGFSNSLNTKVTYKLFSYKYIVLFGPVKPELGGIPSGQKKFNSEHLNFPGKELNVTDIKKQWFL